MRKFTKIMKDPLDELFFGIFSGIALRFDLSVILLRAFVFTTFIFMAVNNLFHVFFIAYIILWAIVPSYDGRYDSEDPNFVSNTQ